MPVVRPKYAKLRTNDFTSSGSISLVVLAQQKVPKLWSLFTGCNWNRVATCRVREVVSYIQVK